MFQLFLWVSASQNLNVADQINPETKEVSHLMPWTSKRDWMILILWLSNNFYTSQSQNALSQSLLRCHIIYSLAWGISLQDHCTIAIPFFKDISWPKLTTLYIIIPVQHVWVLHQEELKSHQTGLFLFCLQGPAAKPVHNISFWENSTLNLQNDIIAALNDGAEIKGNLWHDSFRKELRTKWYSFQCWFNFHKISSEPRSCSQWISFKDLLFQWQEQHPRLCDDHLCVCHQ